MAKSTQPIWTNRALDDLSAETKEHGENIRRIAVRLARHDKATYVDPSHVGHARQVLVKSGYRPGPFYKRTEFEFGVGSALLTLSLAAPDIIGIFADGQTHKITCCIVIPVLVLVGLFLMTHAWWWREK